MNRRDFLKLFAAAGPVAAVAPTYFFAPVGGWKSDVIVRPGPRMMFISNPSGSSWVKERFLVNGDSLTMEGVRKFMRIMEEAMGPALPEFNAEYEREFQRPRLFPNFSRLNISC